MSQLQQTTSNNSIELQPSQIILDQTTNQESMTCKKPKLKVVTRKELEKRMEEKKKMEERVENITAPLVNSVLMRDDVKGIPLSISQSQTSITSKKSKDGKVDLSTKPEYSLNYIDEIPSTQEIPKDMGYSSIQRYSELTGNHKGYYYGPTQSRQLYLVSQPSIMSPRSLFSSKSMTPISPSPSMIGVEGSNVASNVTSPGFVDASGYFNVLTPSNAIQSIQTTLLETPSINNITSGITLNDIPKGSKLEIKGGVFDDNLPPPRNPSAPFSPEFVILPDPIVPFTSESEEDLKFLKKLRLKLDMRIIFWYLWIMFLINLSNDPADLGVLINKGEMLYSLGIGPNFESLVWISVTFGIPSIIFPIVHALFFIKVGPRRSMARTLVLWGALVVAGIAVTNYTGLLTLRVFQGAVATGTWVVWILTLAYWYPGHILATRYSSIILAYGVSMGVLIGIGEGFSNLGPGYHSGLMAWQWTNVIMGVLLLITGMLCMWISVDYPRNTTKLSSFSQPFLTMDELRVTEGWLGEFGLGIEERNAYRDMGQRSIGDDWIQRERTESLEAQLKLVEPDMAPVGWGGIKWGEVKRAIVDWKSISFLFLSFVFTLASSAAVNQSVVSLILINGVNTRPKDVPALFLPQYFVGFVVAFIVAKWSDKVRNRTLFMFVILTICMICAIALAILPVDFNQGWSRYAISFVLLCVGYSGSPLLLAYRMETAAGVTYHAISLALMVSAFNVAFTISPFLFGAGQVLADAYDGELYVIRIGNIVLASLCFLSLFAVWFLRYYESDRVKARHLIDTRARAHLQQIKEDQALAFAQTHVQKRGSLMGVTPSGTMIVSEGVGGVPGITVTQADGLDGVERSERPSDSLNVPTSTSTS